MVITFHGVITTEFLKGFNGRGYVHLWLAVRPQLWCTLGTPCTYIFTEDVDHCASAQKGEVIHQARLHAVPGHLSGVSHNPDAAIRKITQDHFRSKPQEEQWLHLLTQDGRLRVIPPAYTQPEEYEQQPTDHRVCTCDLPTLMTSGCKCGAINSSRS